MGLWRAIATCAIIHCIGKQEGSMDMKPLIQMRLPALLGMHMAV